MARIKIGNIKGPKGDIGPQGPVGPQGPKGDSSTLTEDLAAALQNSIKVDSSGRLKINDTKEIVGSDSGLELKILDSSDNKLGAVDFDKKGNLLIHSSEGSLTLATGSADKLNQETADAGLFIDKTGGIDEVCSRYRQVVLGSSKKYFAYKGEYEDTVAYLGKYKFDEDHYPTYDVVYYQGNLYQVNIVNADESIIGIPPLAADGTLNSGWALYAKIPTIDEYPPNNTLRLFNIYPDDSTKIVGDFGLNIPTEVAPCRTEVTLTINNPDKNKVTVSLYTNKLASFRDTLRTITISSNDLEGNARAGELIVTQEKKLGTERDIITTLSLICVTDYQSIVEVNNDYKIVGKKGVTLGSHNYPNALSIDEDGGVTLQQYLYNYDKSTRFIFNDSYFYMQQGSSNSYSDLMVIDADGWIDIYDVLGSSWTFMHLEPGNRLLQIRDGKGDVKFGIASSEDYPSLSFRHPSSNDFLFMQSSKTSGQFTYLVQNPDGHELLTIENDAAKLKCAYQPDTDTYAAKIELLNNDFNPDNSRRYSPEDSSFRQQYGGRIHLIARDEKGLKRTELALGSKSVPEDAYLQAYHYDGETATKLAVRGHKQNVVIRFDGAVNQEDFDNDINRQAPEYVFDPHYYKLGSYVKVLKDAAGMEWYAGNSNIKTVEYAYGVTLVGINPGVSSNTYFLENNCEELIIPITVKKININVYNHIKYIYYKGTKADWELIEKIELPTNARIFCIDGEVI